MVTPRQKPPCQHIRCVFQFMQDRRCRAHPLPLSTPSATDSNQWWKRWLPCVACSLQQCLYDCVCACPLAKGCVAESCDSRQDFQVFWNLRAGKHEWGAGCASRLERKMTWDSKQVAKAFHDLLKLGEIRNSL